MRPLCTIEPDFPGTAYSRRVEPKCLPRLIFYIPSLTEPQLSISHQITTATAWPVEQEFESAWCNCLLDRSFRTIGVIVRRAYFYRCGKNIAPFTLSALENFFDG